MSSDLLTPVQLDAYRHDGYLTLRSLFTQEEISLLRDTARRDRRLDEHAVSRADASGGASRLALWNKPGDDIYGMFARCGTMAELARQLLDDEPYHYHSKMIMKEPRVGGAWEWHQDYGYWYQNGLLMPSLCSVMIAVDPATRENGCLQVIRGSQRMGRVDHVQNGDQAGANAKRVEVALKRLELVYCELDPGDVVAFDCNTLHRSDANSSDHPRWSMICCYNARSNDPYEPSHHASYAPLSVVPRSSIVEAGRRLLADPSDGSGNASSDLSGPRRDRSAARLESAGSASVTLRSNEET